MQVIRRSTSTIPRPVFRRTFAPSASYPLTSRRTLSHPAVLVPPGCLAFIPRPTQALGIIKLPPEPEEEDSDSWIPTLVVLACAIYHDRASAARKAEISRRLDEINQRVNAVMADLGICGDMLDEAGAKMAGLALEVV